MWNPLEERLYRGCALRHISRRGGSFDHTDDRICEHQVQKTLADSCVDVQQNNISLPLQTGKTCDRISLVFAYSHLRNVGIAMSPTPNSHAGVGMGQNCLEGIFWDPHLMRQTLYQREYGKKLREWRKMRVRSLLSRFRLGRSIRDRR